MTHLRLNPIKLLGIEKNDHKDRVALASANSSELGPLNSLETIVRSGEKNIGLTFSGIYAIGLGFASEAAGHLDYINMVDGNQALVQGGIAASIGGVISYSWGKFKSKKIPSVYGGITMLSLGITSILLGQYYNIFSELDHVKMLDGDSTYQYTGRSLLALGGLLSAVGLNKSKQFLESLENGIQFIYSNSINKAKISNNLLSRCYDADESPRKIKNTLFLKLSRKLQVVL